MKKLLFGITAAIIFIALIFASWGIYLGDLNFFTDVGGDFLLFKEIDEKGLILIGRRSSGGLFHGPLWTYINYPIYIVSNGNPISIAWFWVFLTAFFSGINYFIANKLFKNVYVGLIFSMLSTIYMIPFLKGFIHPYAAIFVLPLYFFFFVRYLETLRIKYLIFHIITAGIMVQLDLAIGIPFTLLSVFYIGVKSIKEKRFKHLLSYLLLFVVLINFVIFNIRHDFIYFNFVTQFLGSHARESSFTYSFLIENKLKWMWVSIDLIRNMPELINFSTMIVLFIFMLFQIKQNKFRKVYTSFLYFYCGFFILSFINKGPILFWYVLPLYVLTLLMVSSLLTSKYKIFFAVLILIMIAQNLKVGSIELQKSKSTVGMEEDSWSTLQDVSKKVFSGSENEFGYFIYSPDGFGYEPKYALYFGEKNSEKEAHYFEKKPVTYLVIVPPPKNNPHMKHEWWRENQVNIKRVPDDVIKFKNGYIIEKYLLTPEEIQIPFDPSINTGFHFR